MVLPLLCSPVCLSVCLSVYLSVCLVCLQNKSSSCGRITMKFFGGVEYMVCYSWLDFGDYPDHDVDTGMSKRNFYHCGWDNFTNFADNWKRC